MIPDGLKAAIETWWKDSGLSEGEALAELGKVIRPDIVGAEVTLRETGRSYFTALPPRGSAASRLSDGDRALVRACGLIAADVEGHLPAAEKKRPAGPVALTDADCEAIRRMGLDPDAVAAQMRDGAA